MPGLATDTHHSPDSLESRGLPFVSPALMPGKLKFRCSVRRYLQVPVITSAGIVQDYSLSTGCYFPFGVTYLKNNPKALEDRRYVGGPCQDSMAAYYNDKTRDTMLYSIGLMEPSYVLVSIQKYDQYLSS